MSVKYIQFSLSEVADKNIDLLHDIQIFSNAFACLH